MPLTLTNTRRAAGLDLWLHSRHERYTFRQFASPRRSCCQECCFALSVWAGHYDQTHDAASTSSLTMNHCRPGYTPGFGCTVLKTSSSNRCSPRHSLLQICARLPDWMDWSKWLSHSGQWSPRSPCLQRACSCLTPYTQTTRSQACDDIRSKAQALCHLVLWAGSSAPSLPCRTTRTCFLLSASIERRLWRFQHVLNCWLIFCSSP